jgi:hypothetical protein
MLFKRSTAVLGATFVLSPIALAVSAGPAAGAGHITYSVGESLLRVEARAGARPQNISAALDRRFPGGGDQFLNQSPDGRWLVIQSQRFGCSDNPCLAVVSSNLRSGRAVRGGTANVQGFSAVGNGGRVVVYPAQSRGNRVDLFVTRRRGRGWTTPRNVTGRSPQRVHGHPAISADSRRVLHDCGPANDPSAGVLSICESRLNGGGTRVRVRPTEGRRPPEGPFGPGSLHHADYLGRGGGLVFESQWCCKGESIWFKRGGRRPRNVRGASGNNVAPCGLPDGRVVSLDLTRPAGGGVHELMITRPTARKRTFVLRPGIDVNDIGIGCGR